MAQNRLDCLADRLGSSVLAAIWRAEFSLLLRHRKYPDRRGLVDGKSADLFLGGLRIVIVSNALRGRSRRRSADRASLHRRDRVHVRSPSISFRPAAESVSPRQSAIVAMGDLAFRIRRSRMEIANTHHVDGRADQLFLASRAGRELGARDVLPRAARNPG